MKQQAIAAVHLNKSLPGLKSAPPSPTPRHRPKNQLQKKS